VTDARVAPCVLKSARRNPAAKTHQASSPNVRRVKRILYSPGPHQGSQQACPRAGCCQTWRQNPTTWLGCRWGGDIQEGRRERKAGPLSPGTATCPGGPEEERRPLSPAAATCPRPSPPACRAARTPSRRRWPPRRPTAARSTAPPPSLPRTTPPAAAARAGRGGPRRR